VVVVLADFGVEGVLDRFGQVEPKILFCADGYRYAGREHDSLDRVAEIAASCRNCARSSSCRICARSPTSAQFPKAVLLEEWQRRFQPGTIPFAQLPFDHPLYILFTSGTTGQPKCIVHSAGGALLSASRCTSCSSTCAGRPVLLLHDDELGHVEPAVRGPCRRSERDAL
jgi:acetoacetyl-CoA synthetase